MSPIALLVMYCGLILAASLIGGWVPLLIRLTHERMELAVSFVSGVMLGVALLHLLPHAWMQRGAWLNAGAGDQVINHQLIDPVLWWLLAGFLGMFFMERFFCFHHHDVPEHNGTNGGLNTAHHGHRLTWTGAAIGLSVHSVIAGVALAASVAAEGRDDHSAALAGLGTFLAIVLHRPFDSMTLGTLMALGRRSMRARHLANALFALVVPLGVGLFFLGAGYETSEAPRLVSCALAFCAGTFLCIALSDLLPELQFHQHDRIKLSAALLGGLGLAWAVGQLDVHQ